MRTASGVRVTLAQTNTRVIKLMISADALAFQTDCFITTAIHADMTPDESRLLAAELLAAAECYEQAAPVVTEETVDGEPGIVARASG